MLRCTSPRLPVPSPSGAQGAAPPSALGLPFRAGVGDTEAEGLRFARPGSCSRRRAAAGPGFNRCRGALGSRPPLAAQTKLPYGWSRGSH